MNRTETDIFIAGAGPAGLIAAAALAATGASVLLVDPAPRPNGQTADLRSTAFLPPARALFRRVGLWDALEPLATPLTALRIVDLAGDPPAVRTERTFARPDGTPLAWNLRNDTLRETMLAHLDRLPNVTLAFGAAFGGLTNRSTGALIRLDDGRQVRARLAVAADGRSSPLRQAAGIGVRVARYGQKALAFAVTHPVPHDGVSTEIYLSGGPFTMVPLPDHDGQPASAVVWMCPGPAARTMTALDDADFADAATRRSGGLFGALTPVTRRALWPVVTQQADRLTEGRVVLVAEAAHVLPPIGAQGLNTSVQDIAALVNALDSDIGGPTMLAAYARARGPDISARAAVVDIFNRVTGAADPLSQGLRQAGLRAAHDVAPLRRALMRAGEGKAVR